MVAISNKKTLEKEIEKRIKNNYRIGNYLKCYKLLKLMKNVNSQNKVLLNYRYKITWKKLKNAKKKWIREDSGWLSFLKSYRFYVSLFIFWITWWWFR